jgi:tripartite-type tricarboxylate transporter receptor subunit TctC
MMFSIASIAKSQIDAGTVRGIGVTSLKSSDLAPNLPSLAQSGLPGFVVVGWNGFVAPKATPKAIIAKLNAVILHSLITKAVREKLRSAGYEAAAPNSPQQFADFIAADTAKWRNLANKTNIKAN